VRGNLGFPPLPRSRQGRQGQISNALSAEVPDRTKTGTEGAARLALFLLFHQPGIVSMAAHPALAWQLRPESSGPGRYHHPTRLLLSWRRDGIFSSLGHAELDHSLRFDLDGFASLGIATHTSLTLRFHQPA
jgi:hypothetical protein